ncbi:helix-turn-helix transcriptional regulator [Rhodospirillaceae bacterium KN72]|uniref:Helix-turn-helix transcriptional regulator n=1 Tax=Pacificispira spongiicola TaxID=2729598 RepID=A0A7Y0HEA9_9PROT|nr:helix-turn-helix transcriptional regulator [Pacificispira spongiicola]NMM44510.1 helix-turn-helix transcriptional regulator [Pacificispira spongiicola]
MVSRKSRSSRLPTDVDRTVGANIQARRVALGLTQTELGTAIGLGASEIQRFESAQDRVSAGMLFHLSQALQIVPDRLFDGATSDLRPAAVAPRTDVMELCQAFAAIRRPQERQAFLRLVKGIALSDALGSGV